MFGVAAAVRRAEGDQETMETANNPVNREKAMVAWIACAGDAAGKKRFSGFKSCDAAVESGFLRGECMSGCVGVGNCVTVCVKGALRFEHGRVVVDRETCDGCGDCAGEYVCPQHLIRLIPRDATNFIPCSSAERDGDIVRAVCRSGCISCGECERSCQTSAIHIADHHAVIDYEKCVGCAVCTSVCTRKIIIDTYHNAAKLKSEVAFVHCGGDRRIADTMENAGFRTCRDAEKRDGEQFGLCRAGCLGLGDCIAACRYEAISIKNGAAYVETEKCVDCKDCRAACPQGLISIVPYRDTKLAACAAGDADAGKCGSSCILCGGCMENCPTGAIYFVNGHAVIEPLLCEGCDVCRSICRRDVIRTLAVPLGPDAPKRLGHMPSVGYDAARSECGEARYANLIRQLFGTRVYPVNAAGEKNETEEGWAHPVTEDADGFGITLRRELDSRRGELKAAVERLRGTIGASAEAWIASLEDAAASAAAGAVLVKQCGRKADENVDAAYVAEHGELLAKPSVWVFGGNVETFRGMDAVLESGLDMNVLLFSREGMAAQRAVERAAACGRAYAAQISAGANLAQARKALREAEAYAGPAVLIAHTPYLDGAPHEDRAVLEMRAAVREERWRLLRYDPTRAEPLSVDSGISENGCRWRESRDAAKYALPPLLKKTEAFGGAINLSKQSHPLPEQPPKERVRHFKEPSENYSAETAVREAMRCMKCREKPCMKQGCPVRNHIPDFIEKIAEGDFEAAYRVLRETTNLPAVCGRVCQQAKQCEGSCVRGEKGEPVAIGNLERFAADWYREHFPNDAERPKAENGRKVAVIGSGPAGIACAGDLAEMGFAVSVFEKAQAAGGVLTYGIPEFRLPKAVVEHELEGLRRKGVRFVTGVSVGTDKTAEELLDKDGYDAIFIGSGAGIPLRMNIPGETLDGVYSADDYLMRINRGQEVMRAKRIAVVGGGSVAMDACRCAVRTGAEKVYVLYRRGEEEMPADRKEAAEAAAEGVEFRFLINPVRIHGDADGRAAGIECVKMSLGEPDASGRRSPGEVEGSNFILDVDCVIMALGTTFDRRTVDGTAGLETSAKGAVTADSTGTTSRPGIFAGGDAVTGPATVIRAMGAGKAAARSIWEYLRNH